MLRVLLAVAAVLVASWLAFCAVVLIRPRIDPVPAHADAVIVLSGSRQRLPPALALIRRGVAPVLALSSVGRSPHWAAAQRLCASRRYGRAAVLCFDAVPYSTRGEAETVTRLAASRGWRSIVVVTSTFHVSRARMLFDRCYRGKLAMRGAPTTWWRLPVEWVAETLKYVVQVTVERGC